jgi:hypothetical protein
MLPYPIPEKTRVLNGWGYPVGWRKEDGGDFIYPLHAQILERKVARNGELWILGTQEPTKNPHTDWIN